MLHKEWLVVFVESLCFQQNVVGLVVLPSFPGHLGRQQPAGFQFSLKLFGCVLKVRPAIRRSAISCYKTNGILGVWHITLNDLASFTKDRMSVTS